MIAIRRRISTPFSGVSGIPATVAEPEVGAMRVPSVRTVVVFPAPFGPRNPNTSPRVISKETSWNAIRSPKRLLSPRTERAVGLLVPREAAGRGGLTRRSPRAGNAAPAASGLANGASAGRLSFLMSHLIRKYITGTGERWPVAVRRPLGQQRQKAVTNRH